MATAPIKLAVLLSGGGRTLVNIAQHIAQHDLPAAIVGVVSSSPQAYGLVRAANLGLPSQTIARKNFAGKQEFSDAIWNYVRTTQADLVCLAGFLSLLCIPDDFVHRVINIHPALLPSFGGPGMFGHKVHEAVLAAGCKVSGCTVHFCDQTYDTGPILVQRCCPVLDDDTPDTLAARVFEQECLAYPEAITLIARNRVQIDGNRVRMASAKGT